MIKKLACIVQHEPTHTCKISRNDAPPPTRSSPGSASSAETRFPLPLFSLVRFLAGSVKFVCLAALGRARSSLVASGIDFVVDCVARDVPAAPSPFAVSAESSSLLSSSSVFEGDVVTER